MTLTVGSVFSGIGGIDLGLQRAGITCCWQVEHDPACLRVLGRHWPDVRRYGDVANVRAEELEPVDIICAGWPCQDLSVAGLRAGLAGKRSGLFFELVRILAVLRPRWVVCENVPGLLSSFSPVESPPDGLPEGSEWEVEETSDLAVVLSCLGELGYGWAYRSLDLQYYGVAQKRKRVFIVGCLGDARRAVKVLFDPESCAWDSAPRREAGARAAGTIAASPGRSRGAGSADGMPLVVAPLRGNHYGDHVAAESHLVAHTIQTGAGQRLSAEDTYIVHTLTSEGADASEDGTGRGVPIIAFDTTQITSKGNYSAPKAGDPCHPLTRGGHPPTIAFDWQSGGDVRLHCSTNGTSALQTNQTPAVLYRAGVRRLTPTECERLFCLPDGYTAYGADGKPISDSARYRMLGNAAPPIITEWIGGRIVAVEEAQAA